MSLIQWRRRADGEINVEVIRSCFTYYNRGFLSAQKHHADIDSDRLAYAPASDMKKRPTEHSFGKLFEVFVAWPAR